MNSEKFIPIKLTEIKNNYHKLLENNFSVILGSPGSGKTFLAKYLADSFNGKYLSVMDFMEEDKKNLLEDINDLLILDGFDEYRIFEESKNFTIKKFARKIKELLQEISFKIILTCRELDWYGDNDSTAIKNILNFDIKLFFIEPLNGEKLNEFLKIYNITNNRKIYNLFERGFVNTPQLFIIAKDILDETINNKIDLYEKFILKSAKEINPYHEEKNRPLSNDEILEYLGYLAYFYMFSNIENFNNEIISEIASQKYNIEIIKQLLKSKLFEKNKFIHRTIAEFLCGNYFAELIKQNKIDKGLIINKFRNKNFIYTELRATYAWLCGISEDFELIKYDPYYQLIYGENNHFSINFKIKILKAIKEYTKNNPYFLDTNSYFLKDELKGFYVQNEDFDNFLKSEFKFATKAKNHYIYVFEMIFTSNQDLLSKNIKKFLYNMMFDNELIIEIKNKLIKTNIFSKSQKKSILEAIKKNEIRDEDNSLKITLIEELYKELSTDEIVKIFKLFKPSNMMYICFFLYEMNFENKKELVLKIEKEIFQNIKNNYNEIFKKWNCLKYFLENFYFELFHTKSADEIYAFLKKVRKFYKEYEQITSDKGYVDKNIKERNEKELQELANKIFELYFNDLRIDKNIFSKIIEFNKWFPLARPTNISKLVINKIKNVKDEDLQKELFWIAMRYWNDKESFNEVFGKLSKKLNLEEELNKFKNPPKSKFEIEREKQIEQERKETIQKNNKFFTNLSKKEFLQHFGALDFITTFILFEKDIEKYMDIELFNKFKHYFKNFIFSKNFLEYAKIEQLAKNLNQHLKIEFVFYASLCLNEDKKEDILRLNDDFLKFLYVLSLREKNLYKNCNNEWFIKFFEKEKLKLAKKAILDFVKFAFKIDKKLLSLLEKKDIKKLKELFYDVFYQKNIIDSIIRVFNFDLNKKELEELSKINCTELLEVFVKFNNYELLNKKELEVFFVNIFDRLNRNIKEKFDVLSEKIRLQIFKNLIIIFNDETKMPFHEGVQSDSDITISFVRDTLLQILKESEIQKLLNEDISKYWQNLLKWQLVKREEISEYKFFRIKELKDFIENKGLLDEKDFFEYVSLKIDELIKRIEANEDNEKDLFWDGNEPKNENKCRDAFVNLFENTNFYFINREEYIGNNRADFAVSSKINEWKVRIECKKDKHPELFNAVQPQLIDKYLKDKSTQYGIYLIFYFGDGKKSINYIKEKTEENIPIEWKYKIKIKIIDLRKDNK